MASTRLGSILEQEYKSKGLISGVSSAVGKRARESMDFRNVLFGGTGLGSIIGRKMFGKGYSATRGVGNNVSSVSQELSSSSSSQLDELNINARITAKNTLALPSMARDMHLVKKNIMQLVKLQGGTPSSKAGDWFNRQAARESAYESNFSKKTPTQIVRANKKEIGGTGMGTGSILLSLFGGLSKSLLPLIGIVGLLGTALGGITTVITGILAFLIRSPLGKLLGITAGAVGLNSLFGGKDTTNSYGDANVTNQKGEMGLVDKTIMGVGGVVATATAVKGGTGLVSAVKGTSNAVLDARTISTGQLANSKPTTMWGKFMKMLATSKPALFKKVGTKLAQAGALMAIPVGGWILALINLGFAFWTAWEIYEMWRKFKNSPEAQEDNGSTEPTQLSFEQEYQTGQQESIPTNTTSPTPSTGISLEQIGQAESGKMGYDAANKGKAGDTPGGIPGLSNMKVGEVMKLQAEKKLFAAGKYQIIPTTLDGLVKQGVVSMDDTFDKSTQDKLAKALYDRRIARAGSDPIKQQLELSKEFASIANPYTGKSYYDGVGNNKASIGGILNEQSTAVASLNRNTGNTTYLDQSQKTTNNNGGGNASAPPAANVLDGEFAKLLSRMV